MPSAGASLAESVTPPPPVERGRPKTVPRGRGLGEEGRLAAGGLTLEERLTSVWEGLLAAGTAECPVCGDRMERSGPAADCHECGSKLS